MTGYWQQMSARERLQFVFQLRGHAPCPCRFEALGKPTQLGAKAVRS